jgi:soluble lytic murein transglycosylase
MSSMVSRILLASASLAAFSMPIACHATQPADPAATAIMNPDGSEWDRARARLLASQPSNIAAQINQWETLSASGNYTFETYSSFLVTHPDWPRQDKMRQNAEQAIDMDRNVPSQIIAYFTQFPPLTNVGKARYAVALHSLGRYDEANAMARQAWTAGTLTDEDEMRLAGLFSGVLTSQDHDERMNALLWAGATRKAERQIGLTSTERRPVFAARLAIQQGDSSAASLIEAAGPAAMTDAGFVSARANTLMRTGNALAARSLLANRPGLVHPPSDPNSWFKTLLDNARAAANDGQHSLAYGIASRVDDAYRVPTDIALQSSGVRDKYSDLMWLAGNTAMRKLGRPSDAVGMFDRYARSYNSPQIRTKGYYWAGRAAQMAGQTDSATRYFELAGQYPDYFYGQLAFEQLGRPLALAPRSPEQSSAQFLSQINAVDPLKRGQFNASTLVQATQEVARNGDWKTQNAFFQALVDKASTPDDFTLLDELARNIGRRDLTVIAGIGARNLGNQVEEFREIAFPQMPVPAGYQNSWTMIHAITRQESQYAQNAVSHAGARGLMQLMPGTANEQAGKMGLSYSRDALTSDPQYNIMLGSGYFLRMLDYFSGSYPLAVAAYNAGPGNVNKWLRANGDPRGGGVDILHWIEEIPIFETRNYVQRVLENAVVYDHLHPERANVQGANKLSTYLGKRTPG